MDMPNLVLPCQLSIELHQVRSGLHIKVPYGEEKLQHRHRTPCHNAGSAGIGGGHSFNGCLNMKANLFVIARGGSEGRIGSIVVGAPIATSTVCPYTLSTAPPNNFTTLRRQHCGVIQSFTLTLQRFLASLQVTSSKT